MQYTFEIYTFIFNRYRLITLSVPKIKILNKKRRNKFSTQNYLDFITLLGSKVQTKSLIL